MHPLVSPEELLAERASISLFDARSGPDVDARFAAERLAGALHVHLDRDLAAVPADAAKGGRHPLPSPAAFAATLGRLGITPDARVVVYDDKGGANAASRFWWMLRAAGHARVQVLDGGLEAALGVGFPTESGPPRLPVSAAPRPFSDWQSPIVDLDSYARLVRDPAALAIDARSPSRYRGEGDAFDPNPGHVEGAVNVFYEENLGPDGRFAPAEELAAKYRALLAGRPSSAIVAQCGSGVTACHTLLALEVAGLPGGALYVGSFSEWTRRGLPVAKG